MTDTRTSIGDKKINTNCRFCDAVVSDTFVDLGLSPLCESFVPAEEVNEHEKFYPLHAIVCANCLLVQLDEYVTADDIFSEYAYFSSYSDSWVEHAKMYCIDMQSRLGLGSDSQVIEIASNDGYLLQHFVDLNIPVLGIEPALNVSKVALDKNVPTENLFFGVKTAKLIKEKYGTPDLLLGNNVLAHVPDLNDFVAGMKVLLAETGTITMEFPHLYKLMHLNQFDTIYHEHFCYFSLLTVENIFANHGLRIFDVEQLKTHGGSLRIFAVHAENEKVKNTERLDELRSLEIEDGFDQIARYREFTTQVEQTKRDILEFLIRQKQNGQTIVGYGAPGKGNTLLNYCGIRTDFLDFTVDRNPYKHGRYTPGTRIPIYDTDKIAEHKPDLVFILPWNLADEITEQLDYIREWGGKFVIPIPSIKVL